MTILKRIRKFFNVHIWKDLQDLLLSGKSRDRIVYTTILFVNKEKERKHTRQE